MLLDDKKVLKVEIHGTLDARGYLLSDTGTRTPILDIIENENGTHMYLTDDYIQLKFLAVGKQAEIKGLSAKQAIVMLLKNAVMKADGTIDETKLDLFIKNYDEHISSRTIIVH